jgi:hypothetical protein
VVKNRKKYTQESVNKANKRIQDKLEEIQQEKIKLLSNIFYGEALPNVMSSPAVLSLYTNAIIKVFIEWQSKYFDPAPAVQSTDRTGFDFHRASIADEVAKNIIESANKYRGKKGPYKMHLLLLSDDFTGKTSRGDKYGNRPVQWATYFIDGMDHKSGDKLLWMNLELMDALDYNSKGNLGRFGTGVLHILTPKREKGLSEKLSGLGLNINDYIHPQSYLKEPLGFELVNAAESVPADYIANLALKEAEKLFLATLTKKK